MIRKFLTGTKTLLLNRPIVDGQILFPNDTTEIYFDINNIRRKFQGISYVQNNSDLSGISNPEEKLYFSIGSGTLFVYDSENQEFVQVNRTGVITNLTSSQRMALTSCAEDSIYVDSDTSIAYIGVNLGSNSGSSSISIPIFWRKVGESISNYNGLVDIRTNNKNVINTDSNGNITIGDNSNSVNINGRISIDRRLVQVNSTNLNIHDFGMYYYILSGNETFVFGEISGNKIIDFKLYLMMPSTLVSFNWPLNVVWEEEPDLTTANSLYMFAFEWNPILGKWLGNQFWPTINMSSNSSSFSIN